MGIRQDNSNSHYETLLRDYFHEVVQLGPEPARAERFRSLLRDLFGHEPNLLKDLLGGIESGVVIHDGALVHRGRIDSLCGNLVIEFERTLDASGRPGETARKLLDDAQGQLCGYVSGLWSAASADSRHQYVAMATDGVLFAIYTPLITDPQLEKVSPADVTLQPLTEELIDLSKLDPSIAYTWLDRHFLRQTKRPPLTAEIVDDFGLHSHAFTVTQAELLRLWADLGARSEFAVLFDSWDNYLRIAYGSSFRDMGGTALFIRHTYLSTLAKLMVWARFRDQRQEGKPVQDDEIAGVLSGHEFESIGISNFLEEDFFAWVTRAEARADAIGIAHRLHDMLDAYDLKALNEDVFKGLYEQLVDPEGRHDLGEYYTPDWLAERLVRRLLRENPQARTIDPACGSGTFLYAAIACKRKWLQSEGSDPGDVLSEIQSQVCGMDVHPLAVTVAKANYLLAVADLLESRKGPVVIPVYLANSIREIEKPTHMPSRYPDINVVRMKPDTQSERLVYIPEQLARDADMCDLAIDACKRFAEHGLKHGFNENAFRAFINKHLERLPNTPSLMNALMDMSRTLGQFMAEGRDSIQAYVLKNQVRPSLLHGLFDVVMGNPPWLSFRFIQTPQYQAEVKSLMKDYGLVHGGRLSTQMELAALFLLRSADLYLAQEGTIGFVLPKSIYNADQHDRFRRRQFGKPDLIFRECWDLEQVHPLFGVPAAVLIADKDAHSEAVDTIPEIRLAGRLSRRNATLDEANEALTVGENSLSLRTMGKRSFWASGDGDYSGDSPYEGVFAQGASVVPRCLWFVEKSSGAMGHDPSLPLMRTSSDASEHAKKPWNEFSMEGRIESEFVRDCLLGTDIVPFGMIASRPTVIPAVVDVQILHVLNSNGARSGGNIYLSEWLDKAEGIWETGRSDKADGMTLYERLDYGGLLSRQVRTRPCVVFARLGTVPVSATVPPGIILDYTLYWAVFPQMENHYLCAAFNSDYARETIKPMQVAGQMGPRNVAGKLADLPFPRYDADNKQHRRLAVLSKRCTKKVSQWIADATAGDTEEQRAGRVTRLRAGIGRTRIKVRALLVDELSEIDRIVREIVAKAS